MIAWMHAARLCSRRWTWLRLPKRRCQDDHCRLSTCTQTCRGAPPETEDAAGHGTACSASDLIRDHCGPPVGTNGTSATGQSDCGPSASGASPSRAGPDPTNSRGDTSPHPRSHLRWRSCRRAVFSRMAESRPTVILQMYERPGVTSSSAAGLYDLRYKEAALRR
jgi:hypothetical protein